VGRPNRDFDHNYDTINAAYHNQINDWLNTQVKAGYRSYDRRWGEDNYPPNLALREHDGVKQQIIPLDLTFNLKHWKERKPADLRRRLPAGHLRDLRRDQRPENQG
jgi:hypothetical protein